MAEERDEGLTEMVVESVRVQMRLGQHIVILKELDRERYLPIWIGQWEANAIAMKLQGATPDRPMTHDTFMTSLEALGAELRRVVIVDLADETFHARLHLVAGERALEIDSRPSDALALAVRSGARIFAASTVLARAGIVPEGSSESGEAFETTGESLPDERLEVFRDFVNSLEVDVEGEQREGPEPS